MEIKNFSALEESEMTTSRIAPFTLEFDPNPSGGYTHGYWLCYAEPGYDGVGETPIDAMAACITNMSKMLVELKRLEVPR